MLSKLQEKDTVSAVQTTLRSWYDSLSKYLSTENSVQSNEEANSSASFELEDLRNHTTTASMSKKTSRERSGFEANIVPSLMLEPNHIKNPESSMVYDAWQYASGFF